MLSVPRQQAFARPPRPRCAPTHPRGHHRRLYSHFAHHSAVQHSLPRRSLVPHSLARHLLCAPEPNGRKRTAGRWVSRSTMNVPLPCVDRLQEAQREHWEGWMEMVCCSYRPKRHIGYCLEGVLTCEESFQTNQTTARLCVERGGELRGREAALKRRTYRITIISTLNEGGLCSGTH